MLELPCFDALVDIEARRDVAEVLEVMTELWLDELAQPGQTVTVADLGKLVVEVQNFHSGGTVKQNEEETQSL